MESIIVAIAVIAVILFLSFWVVTCDSVTPEVIGDIGESRTAYYLHRLPIDTYMVFNDVIVADSEGRTTQIDHIVVSCYGIFVVETKCYKGWIFGDEKSRTWTQSLCVGSGWFASSEKHIFQNPIRQNWRHIYVLAERLRLPRKVFFNVVAFSGEAEFKTKMPYYVMSECDVVEYIKSYTDSILSESIVKGAYTSIRQFALHSESAHEEAKALHVQMLDKYHNSDYKNINDKNIPLCPKCGARMRKRYRHSDSAPFYGCARYPACKGTRNISTQNRRETLS